MLPILTIHKVPPRPPSAMAYLSRYGMPMLAVLALVLTGCASSGSMAERDASSPAGGAVDGWRVARQPSARAAASPEAFEATYVATRLWDEAHRWHGTPYRYGGAARDGIDCSAFVQAVYRDVLGLTLPRTTAEQVRMGDGVPLKALQPGDLVFFRPTRKGRHVGIYLGDGAFAHASTSEGVTTSYLDEPYWQTTYWTSRRFLPSLAKATPAPSEPAPVARSTSSDSTYPPATAGRTGW